MNRLNLVLKTSAQIFIFEHQTGSWPRSPESSCHVLRSVWSQITVALWLMVWSTRWTPSVRSLWRKRSNWRRRSSLKRLWLSAVGPSRHRWVWWDQVVDLACSPLWWCNKMKSSWFWSMVSSQKGHYGIMVHKHHGSVHTSVFPVSVHNTIQ